MTYAAGAAALGIRFTFSPATEPSARQSRLAIGISTWAKDEQVAQALQVLIECSDLSTYYGLQVAPLTEAASPEGRAICHISRVERATRPLHTAEMNPAIPPVYYTCTPFEPRSSNDYLGLDRILNRVKEPVSIDMQIGPVDISEEQFVHTRYLARLQSINRWHDHDDGDLNGDPFEQGAYQRSVSPIIVKPMRRRDPIADDVLHSRRRFHETLSQPHLAFHLRVTADTPAVAQLVASTVAELAFKDGSYRLWNFTAGDSRIKPASMRGGKGEPPSTLDLVLREHAAIYEGFKRLAYVATVDELLGVFTLPVGSRSPLRCIRKNTEPPLVLREQLLVFGHDD
jgi:hypothetical protein